MWISNTAVAWVAQNIYYNRLLIHLLNSTIVSCFSSLGCLFYSVHDTQLCIMSNLIISSACLEWAGLLSASGPYSTQQISSRYRQGLFLISLSCSVGQNTESVLQVQSMPFSPFLASFNWWKEEMGIGVRIVASLIQTHPSIYYIFMLSCYIKCTYICLFYSIILNVLILSVCLFVYL